MSREQSMRMPGWPGYRGSCGVLTGFLSRETGSGGVRSVGLALKPSRRAASPSRGQLYNQNALGAESALHSSPMP